jgi:hypothetical protein
MFLEEPGSGAGYVGNAEECVESVTKGPALPTEDRRGSAAVVRDFHTHRIQVGKIPPYPQDACECVDVPC